MVSYKTLSSEQRRLIRRWRELSRQALATWGEHRDPCSHGTSAQYGRGDTQRAALAFIECKAVLKALRAQGIEPAHVR